ncbi:MAG: type IX secretion system membrane protein PorP/SprF [Crocinitomicaceae bacterium]|nr:type IX secretion system membrane protein PorP/SprF [Crocinitomicaceae bacterium]
MKKILLITSIFIGSLSFSQIDANYSFFGQNRVDVSPSYVGSHDGLEAVGLFRAQWVSFPGAPLSQALAVHTRLENQKIGLGLNMNNTSMGPLRNTGIFGNFAYRMRVGYNSGFLSFGIRGGVYLRSNGLGDLSTVTTNDPEFAANVASQILPNVGFGAHYESRLFYIGVSAPRLLINDVDDVGGVGGLSQVNRLMYITAGAEFTLSRRKFMVMKPNLMVKMQKNVPFQFTLSAPIHFNEKAWAGLTWRGTEAIGFTAGVILDSFSVGYAFDYSIQNQSFKFNGATHEVMLRFQAFEKVSTQADSDGSVE